VFGMVAVLLVAGTVLTLWLHDVAAPRQRRPQAHLVEETETQEGSGETESSAS
jgi:hypothetical protein